MDTSLLTPIFNMVATLGSFAIATFGAIQIYNTFSDRKLKEVIERAKQNSVGKDALDELLTGQMEIKKDLAAVDEKIKEIQVDEIKYKNQLQERFDRLKEHVEKTTLDLLRMFTSQNR